MAILDMFDKLDDIIYKPVETVCDWIKEPLRASEHRREMKRQQMNIEATERANAAARAHELNLSRQAAENDAAQKRLDQELIEEERESIRADLEARAKIDADIRRWNAEIDQMILEQEDARRDRLVECIKRYQIDLANATTDIVENIGMMSLELREKANELVQQKTESYIEMQKKAETAAMERLEEIDVRFANNERVRIRMEDSVIDNMNAIIDHANELMKEIAADFKRLNQNTDDLMRMGMENTNRFLQPMSNGLGVTLPNPDEIKKLETIK